MNLKITKDQWDNQMHIGPLFDNTEERVHAYQDESIRLRFSILGNNPRRQDGSLNHEMPEPDHDEYTLEISRHTGKALSFKLKARRKDTIEQRKQIGAAVTHDVLITSMSFAELVNRIFGPGAQVFHEEEHFPAEVKAVMRTCYR